MAVDIKATLRDTLTNAVVDLIDAGGGAGYLQVRSGAQPANCEAANSGTLLSSHTLQATAFGASSGGTATAASIGSDTNATGGTAGHFRIFDFANVCILQGSCGNGTGDLAFSPTNVIVGGGTVNITSMTYTTPQQGP